MKDPENTTNFDTSQIDALAAFEENAGLPAIKGHAELMNVEQPVDLEKLFEDLYWTQVDLYSEISVLTDVIMSIEKMKEDIAAPYEEKIEKIKEQIKSEVLKRKDSFSCLVGSAYYKRGYERISFDSKKLQGYSAAHPEINDFKKVSFVEPVVSISVGEQK